MSVTRKTVVAAAAPAALLMAGALCALAAGVGAGAGDRGGGLVRQVELASPVGTVVGFAGRAAPGGWLMCDGSRVPDGPAYDQLDAVLGRAYGEKDGRSLLPDLRGRVAMGVADEHTPNLTRRSLGATPGTETVKLEIPNMPKHGFKGTTGSGNKMEYRVVGAAGMSVDHPQATGFQPGANYKDRSDTEYPASEHNHDFVTNELGEGKPIDIIPPALVVNYIVRY